MPPSIWPAASTGYRVVGTLLGVPFALLLLGFAVGFARTGIGSKGRRVVVEGARLTAYNFLGVRSTEAADIAAIELRPRVWFGGSDASYGSDGWT